LRGRIAELAERLAGVEERLSRLVITQETVEEALRAAEILPVPPTAGQAEEMVPAGYDRPLVIREVRGTSGPPLGFPCGRRITGTC
jgi:hypothetical protein